MVTVLEVFADIVCPFTHVGLLRLVQARREYGASTPIRVRAWPLEWVNGRPVEAATVAEEIEALRANVAPDEFRGFDPASFPASSIPAFAVAHVAYDVSGDLGERTSLALRHTLFDEGRDPCDPDVLATIAAAAGLDATTVPTIEEAEALVRVDWDEGKRRGVEGSPHFFFGDDTWFCPVLDISRDDRGTMHVRENVEREREFFDHVFG